MQIATATSTTTVVDAESWRDYVSVTRQISTLRKQWLRRFAVAEVAVMMCLNFLMTSG